MDWFEYREAEFNLWCKVIKADRKGKSSLEYRVRDHANVRQLFLDLLDGLRESLSHLLELSKRLHLVGNSLTDLDSSSEAIDDCWMR
ncbi:hypothetical protein CABS03_00952 [Colletotrichum abscissum]|uniref:Uncharacterized protein n=1 Tax=Colletotrichum abscissum TaxID=1671311 RepID=A0A9Q0B0Z9_9PEZI|nr:hypothetical protein CABS02_10288 [Colletotrichum abscissum]